MSLARIVFAQKKLRKRYGYKGSVAGRYLEAGFSVRLNIRTKSGVLDILAVKGSTRLAIDVRTIDEVREDDLASLAEKAKSLKAKPVLVVYGAGGKLDDKVVSKAHEYGILIKRVR
ncbi:MAG: hypothetical protein ABWW69_06590 [Pyrodictiaceae archaeon]